MHGSGQIQHSKQDQHQADRKFHGKAYARRYRHSEQDYACAYGNDSDGVAATPENADERGLQDGALAADDGGHRDYMIGIGGVAHAKQEPDSQNCETAGHDLLRQALYFADAAARARGRAPYLSIA